jgi:hypothetical protein
MPELATLTRVKDGEEGNLRNYLRELSSPAPRPAAPAAGLDADGSSPFAGVLAAGTHFARFVVIDIPAPHLLFSTRFDGEESEYLAALAGVEQARRIWERCRKPSPVNRETLHDYLLNDKHDRVQASYVVRAFDQKATVGQINHALELRALIARFAAGSQDLDAVALAHTFRGLEPVRRLAHA